MNFEIPSTPVHSLQLLKENMRTEILFYLHERIRVGMNAPGKKPPLFNIIESIGDILDVFSDARFSKCVGRNPYNTEHFTVLSRFNPEREARHDIELLAFHLEFLEKKRAELEDSGYWESDSEPDSCQTPPLFSSASESLTDEQIRVAERIDAYAKRVLPGDEPSDREYGQFLASMRDYTDDFKFLLDACSHEQMSELCERYDGFFRFAKALEMIAQGLSDGSIPKE
jgi:type IV secretory pathway VirB4 component